MQTSIPGVKSVKRPSTSPGRDCHVEHEQLNLVHTFHTKRLRRLRTFRTKAVRLLGTFRTKVDAIGSYKAYKTGTALASCNAYIAYKTGTCLLSTFDTESARAVMR